MKRLVEAIRLVDPSSWPSRLVLGVFSAIVLGPVVLELLGVVDIPQWLILPAAGVVAWRSQRRRYRDIATWVVPLAAIDVVAFELAAAAIIPVEGFSAIYLLLFFWAVTMVFSERAQNVWLSVVAAGHYSSMPDADRALSHALNDLDIEMWEAQKRLAKTQDLAAFRRRLTNARQTVAAIAITDPDWNRVRQLWLHYLDWWTTMTSPRVTKRPMTT